MNTFCEVGTINAEANLTEIGLLCSLLGLVGDDFEAETLKQVLSHQGLVLHFICSKIIVQFLRLRFTTRS